jgi:hypothetical protein
MPFLNDTLNGLEIASQALEIASIKNKLQLGDLTARWDAREALELVNAVESHNRKWSIRILGFPVPTGVESKD